MQVYRSNQQPILIADALAGKSSMLPRDHLIMLPPQYCGAVREFINLTFGWIWHWCFPKIQAGVYRGRRLMWQSFPAGDSVNKPTRLLLWKITSGQIDNVKVLDTRKDN